MQYKTDIEELIRIRYSTRNYSDEMVETHHIENLTAAMTPLNNQDYRFSILNHSFEEGVKVATYGFIKNAKRYIVAIGKKSKSNDLDFALKFGYDFEQIILKATDLGLGTCWMAMSFKSEDIHKQLHIKEDEQIVMASPFGYSSKTIGFQKLTRVLIKADQRKEPSQLFFEGHFDQPLELSHIGDYVHAFEAVRLAPSAGNAQPWRVVRQGQDFDFYVVSKKMYENRKNQAIELGFNDLGIAQLHFDLVARKYGLKGRFIKKDKAPLDEAKYAYSWVCE